LEKFSYFTKSSSLCALSFKYYRNKYLIEEMRIVCGKGEIKVKVMGTKMIEAEIMRGFSGGNEKWRETAPTDRWGICQKCGRFDKLEFGHIEYEPDNSKEGNNGRLICRPCNVNEFMKGNLSEEEQGRITRRDYHRRVIKTYAMTEFSEKNIQIVTTFSFNINTGIVTSRYSCVIGNNRKKLFVITLLDLDEDRRI